MPASVGQRLVEIISAGGVDAMFGVPGGQTLSLYGAARRAGLTHVVMRDERSAACAADAYARVSGQVGICDATVGPGTTNLVSGIAEAYASSVPIVALIADTQGRLSHLKRRAVVSQALDQRLLLEGITKWVGRVDNHDSLDDVIDQALRVATTGRPGPVAVEIAEDVFMGDLGEEAHHRNFGPASFRYPRFRPAAAKEDIDEVVDLLAGAQRPLIFAGGGVLLSGAERELTSLAEGHHLPAVTTINGKGSIDERSELAAGVTGMFGTVRANTATRSADVVLVIGSKLDALSTHRWRSPGPDQTVIHIDIDGEEIGRAVPVALGVVADARAALVALDEALQARPLRVGNWLGTIEQLPGPGTSPGDARVAPEQVAREISEVLGPDDLLVCDASLASGWGAAHTVVAAGRRMIAPRGLAGIGWSGGAAIGARLAADPSSRVVVLAGDGGWAYGLSEMETAVRLGLDLTYVILNNSTLGWIKHIEDRSGIEPPSLFSDVDYSAVARGMGARGAQVGNIEAVGEELHRGLSHPGAYLVDVLSSQDASPIIQYDDVKPAAYAY